MFFWSEIFTQDWYAKFPDFPNFSEFFDLQKYSKFIGCYRLFCVLTDFIFFVLFDYFDESMGWV